ncbi:Translation machinery-associated protein [Hortaea werneckii]|nr:Translation machinery-associated protein [Hortaea werneckii]KAI7304728.1 Translation machinery-associated protein [Hortaea werneckii]
MATTAPPPTDLRPAKSVVYCGVCSLPPEYCEYGGTTKKCSDWLAQYHPSLHATLYSADSTAEGLSTLSVEAQKRAEKDAQKKAAKASATEAKEAEKRATSRIYIKRVERNKRKYVTEVSGLEHFGLDLKKIAKEFGKKFATGSSVTKNAGGTGDEITVQGDVSEDIEEWLLENYEGKIPEDNIELIEDKKKGKGGAGAGAAA